MEMKNRLLLLFSYLLLFPVAISAQTEWSEQVARYEGATETQRVAEGNRLMKRLYDEFFIEELPRFSRTTPLDSMDKKVIYAITEYYFYQLGDFKSAIVYGQKVADICVAAHDEVLEGECQSILAVAHFRLADYPRALRHAHRDLELQRKQKNISNMSSSLNTLAGIYLASKQYEEAYKYISEAIPLSTQAGDSARMAIQMGMATEILQAMHRSDEAVAFARKAFVLDSLRGNLPKAAIRLSQLASALMDLQRNEEAEVQLLRALPLLEKAGNQQSLAICHNQLGELSNRKGNPTAAMRHFEASLPFFQKIGDKYNEAKAREGAYEALKMTDPVRAMQHLRALSVLKDSLYSQETKRHLTMAHAKYHNEELLLQHQHDLKVHRLTVGLALAVVLMLLAVLGVVVLALRNRKRRLQLLRQLQDEKESFFTNITHEFRTPLTIILGLAQRLRHGLLDDDESVESVAAIIDRQGQALLDLVNQLLDIARTDRVIIEKDFRQDDVVAFVHMVVESCEELAKQKHIALQYMPEETSVQLCFVPDYMEKIMVNLIANALKFTPDYGNVRVTSGISRDSKHYVLSVSDNGEGIPEDFLPHVFDTFAGHRGTNGETSTGVGLALVKKLVEALGGTVSVESEVGKGSTFRVQLPYEPLRSPAVPVAPLKRVPAAAVEPRPDDEVTEVAEPAERGSLSILIVEDNDDVFYYMEHVLKKADYVLFHARNGEEGYEKAQAIVPDLIVTDVMMPVMDGFELCKQLKASQVTNHIPVIVVTARNSESDKLRGLDCGAECYLYKPFRAEELLTRVRNIFERRRIWREKFVDQIREQVSGESTTADYSSADSIFMSKVNDYIFAHMEEGNISVDSLASHMCMSSKQLNRKLPNIVGYSVSVYIAQQRMARACRLLQSTDERINVIALRCGFDNPSNFSRTFKDTMECSPSEWRNREKTGK